LSDLMKYAVPLLAGANVSGRFSLELDQWRLPLDEPETGSGSGRLLIHRIEVEPGPLAYRLGEVLANPPTIELARETTVPFSLADGRIHHRDLKFTLRNVTLRSQGSVGLDQTLDLLVEVELPEIGGDRPLLQALRKVSIPIGGTLEHPTIDRTALQQTGRDAVRGILEGLLRKGMQRTPKQP
jgi:hypothetical protein